MSASDTPRGAYPRSADTPVVVVVMLVRGLGMMDTDAGDRGNGRPGCS